MMIVGNDPIGIEGIDVMGPNDEETLKKVKPDAQRLRSTLCGLLNNLKCYLNRWKHLIQMRAFMEYNEKKRLFSKICTKRGPYQIPQIQENR